MPQAIQGSSHLATTLRHTRHTPIGSWRACMTTHSVLYRTRNKDNDFALTSDEGEVAECLFRAYWDKQLEKNGPTAKWSRLVIQNVNLAPNVIRRFVHNFPLTCVAQLKALTSKNIVSRIVALRSEIPGCNSWLSQRIIPILKLALPDVFKYKTIRMPRQVSKCVYRTGEFPDAWCVFLLKVQGDEQREHLTAFLTKSVEIMHASHFSPLMTFLQKIPGARPHADIVYPYTVVLPTTITRDGMIDLICDIVIYTINNGLKRTYTADPTGKRVPVGASIRTWNNLIAHGMFKEMISTRPILNDEVIKGCLSKANCPTALIVRPYKHVELSQEDIERMDGVYMTPTERLVFVLLRHVALRAAAISKLKIGDIWSVEHSRPQIPAVAHEKNAKLRTFTVDDEMSRALVVFLDTHRNHTDPEAFLFEQQTEINGCYNRDRTIAGAVVHSISTKAGLCGPQFHPHAFRAAIVSYLISRGNSLDFVSKWIGHNDTHVTNAHYWKQSAASLEFSMNIPWINVGTTLQSIVKPSAPTETTATSTAGEVLQLQLTDLRRCYHWSLEMAAYMQTLLLPGQRELVDAWREAHPLTLNQEECDTNTHSDADGSGNELCESD